MEEKTETIPKVDPRSKGWFKKGTCPNPKGNNQFTTIVPLIEALRDEGKKRGEDFWPMVARKAFTNNTILICILKKLVPDRIHNEGALQEFKNIIYNINPKAISPREISALQENNANS